MQADGQAIPSVAYNLIRQMQDEREGGDLTEEQDKIARSVAGVAYAGTYCTFLKLLY